MHADLLGVLLSNLTNVETLALKPGATIPHAGALRRHRFKAEVETSRVSNIWAMTE
jgi:hypothetical protein